VTITAKTSVTADTSDLLDETPADAGDVLAPVTDILTNVRSGQAAVSDTDTHVKHLYDVFSFGAGLGYGLGNPGAAEFVGLHVQTTIAPLTVLGGFAAFINLAGIPATYEHLRLVVGLRTSDPGVLADLLVRCNNDTAAANYASLSSSVQHSAVRTTAQTLEGGTTGGHLPNTLAGGGATAGYQGVIYFDFYEYAQTGRPRTCRWQGLLRTGNTTGLIRLTKGWFMWKNTAAALNQIVLLPASGFNFVSGSGYALYGIR
jgi:hypothetical protein